MLSVLEFFPAQLEAHYALVPDAFKHWAPASWEGVPSEALTAIEHVCHVHDIEVEGYHVRFQRTLEETHPRLVSIDTDALARERNYGARNADEVLKSFREARAKTVLLLRGLTSEQFDRTADFEGYGAVTIRSLIHYLCSHDQQHLAGLQWLLGKIDSHRSSSR